MHLLSAVNAGDGGSGYSTTGQEIQQREGNNRYADHQSATVNAVNIHSDRRPHYSGPGERWSGDDGVKLLPQIGDNFMMPPSHRYLPVVTVMWSWIL